MNITHESMILKKLETVEQKVKAAIVSKSLDKEDCRVQQLLTIFDKIKNDKIFFENNKATISKLISQLSEHDLKARKIGKLCSIFLSSGPYSASKPIPISFMCDVDNQDYNGVVLWAFSAAIEEKESVVIASRRMFSAADQIDHFIDHFYGLKERTHVMRTMDEKFEIYEKGGYILFVPRKLKNILDDLNDVKKISLKEAWSLIDVKLEMKAFTELFSSKPQHNKIFQIVGHGSVANPAGLAAKHYEEFLEFIESQNCRGLLVESCYSGGTSSMLHLKQIKAGKFNPTRKESVPYPVIIRSIGDFSSRGMQEGEKQAGKFFNQFLDMVEKPGGLTLPKVRNIVRNLEKEKKKKVPVNAIQVYFPSSKDSIGGFRALGEGEDGYSLTAARYKIEKFEKNEVKVSKKSFISVSPGFINCPLAFEEEQPIILSMIPGKALHLFTEINLEALDPITYLSKNSKFYKDNKIGVAKTFCISSLKSVNREINQVFMNMKTGDCGFFEKGRFYLTIGTTKKSFKEAGEIEFVSKFLSVVEESLPDENAISFATGSHGRESKNEIKEELKKETFWGSQRRIFDKYERLLKNESCPDKLQQLIEGEKLSKQACVELIAYLLKRDEKIASKLYENLKVDPNSKDFRGFPLLIIALQKNCFAFAKKLIEEGTDVNSQEQVSLESPLAIALKKKNKEFIEFLLNKKEINMSILDKNANPAFLQLFLVKLPIEDLKEIYGKFQTLYEQTGCKLEVDKILYNSSSGNKYSLLSLLVRLRNKDLLKYFLERGADPNSNTGDCSPLTQAILNNDKEIITLLLDYKADALKKDSKKGKYPILEAIQRCPFSTLKFLVKDNKIEDSELLHPILLEAIATADEKKIVWILKLLKNNLLLKEQGIGKDYVRKLKTGFKNLLIFKNEDLIKHILRQTTFLLNPLSEILSYACMEVKPEALIAFMKKSWDLPRILKIVSSSLISKQITENEFKKILHQSRSLKVDLSNCAVFADKLFADALKCENLAAVRLFIEEGAPFESGQNNQPPLLLTLARFDLDKTEVRETFKWLVKEKGAKVNAMYFSETPFYRIVASGDKELYAFCLQHGAKKYLAEKENAYSLIQAALGSGKSGGEKIVKSLIKRARLELNERDIGNFATLFSCIVDQASQELIEWCINKGADLSPKKTVKLLPLHAAAASRHPEAISNFKLLIKKGADINQIGWNQSPVILAVLRTGEMDLIQFCFDNGAQIPNKFVNEAFNQVLYSGNSQALVELQKRGYAPTEWNNKFISSFLKIVYKNEGYEMLIKAMQLVPKEFIKPGKSLTRSIINNNDLAAMKALEHMGFPFNAKEIFEREWFDPSECFSLKNENRIVFELLGRLGKETLSEILKKHVVSFIEEGNEKLLQFALEHGVEPDFKVECFLQPFVELSTCSLIFQAIQYNNPKIVEIILAKNANLTSQHLTWTPLSFAMAKGNIEIIKLIQEKL